MKDEDDVHIGVAEPDLTITMNGGAEKTVRIDNQPKRSKRQVEDRRFDQTQLHEAHHGTKIHRDYAAHFFRWGWVARQVKPGEHILDVGCGQDQPLAKVLAGRPGGDREHYVGVDLNKIAKKFGAKWAHVLDEFNFIERRKELLIDDAAEGEGAARLLHQVDGFDRIVCLEVIEHMGPADGRALLEAFQDVIITDGTLYLSTPVFDGYAAANHIHEYTVPELQELIESCGFTVERRIGTFANISTIKKVLTREEKIVYDRLIDWFGNDVISTIFACNYPDHSRNNLWVCRPNA